MRELVGHDFSDGWKVVETRSKEKFAKAKKYLEKTVKNMNDLLAEFEAIRNDFQHISRSFRIDIQGRKVEKIKEEMKNWPENIETYIEVVLATFAEEWDAAEETFTDEFINDLAGFKRNLDRLLGKEYSSNGKPCSTKELDYAIDQFNTHQNLSLLAGIGEILENMRYELSRADHFIKVEERMITADHIYAQQLLGNKYLRDMAQLLRRETEQVLKLYAQAIEEESIAKDYKDKGRHMPALAYTESRNQVQVKVYLSEQRAGQMFFHATDLNRDDTIKKVIVILEIILGKDQYVQQFNLWFDAMNDRFVSEEGSRKPERSPYGYILDRKYEYSSLEDFLEHVGRKIYFVEVDITKQLRRVASKGSPLLRLMPKAA